MDVVGHNDEFSQCNIGVIARYIEPVLVDDFSDGVQCSDFGLLPEPMMPVLGTNGDEIGTIIRIIPRL